MAGKKYSIKVAVLADTSPYKKAMSSLGEATGLTQLAQKAKNIGATIAKIGTGAGIAIGTYAVKAASDFEQSAGTINDIFKAHAGEVHKFASTAYKDVGLSANAYNELAAVISTQLKNGGTSMEQLANKSNDLIKLGADLSAGFGGSTADAVAAISSALKGERDPIEKYGVSLKQAAIDAKAAEMGFQKVGGSLTNEANQAATLALIMEQTSDFHGKFSKENDTLAHKIQVCKAQIDDFATRLGNFLLPIITDAVGWVQENLTPAFEELGTWIETSVLPAVKSFAEYVKTDVIPTVQNIVKWIADNKETLSRLAIEITAGVVAWKAYKRAIMAMAAVKKVITAIKAAYAAWQTQTIALTNAQKMLKIVTSTTPLGIIITLVAALVAGIITLWHTNEGFRNTIISIWQTICEFFSNFVNTVKGFFSGLKDSLGEAWETIKTAAVTAFNTVVSAFLFLPTHIAAIIVSLKDAISDKFQSVISFFQGVPSKITSALGDLGSLLWNAGKKVIQGFVDGIKSMWGEVKGALGKLTSFLPDWKGPANVDSRILRNAGKLVIGGFITGMESQYRNVEKSLGGLSGALSGYLTPEIKSFPSLTPAALAPATVYNIHISALTPSPEIGRKVKQAIQEYERAGGR